MITIDKITMAVEKMDEMVKFYSNTFGVSFTSFEAYESELYSGRIGSMELLLCPKAVAQVDADINTIQLRFVVSNIKEAFQNGLQSGGKLLTNIQEAQGSLVASLRDPDGNSLELVQHSK